MSHPQCNLPHAAELFDALRKGRHLCVEDGELYFCLRDRRDEFAALFAMLGFDFQEHPRGFFYFRGSSALSEQAERMTLFMFILIEDLATRGEPVEESLMTARYDPATLPHFQGERTRQHLHEAGVKTQDDLSALLKQMERLGFLQGSPDGTFCFRPPACRFLDCCLRVLESEGGEEADHE